MRGIRFRAWGGDERKYFVYFGLYGQESGYFTDEYVQPDNTQHVIDYKNVIAIQQLTGLKDKNSKEIYEGDIVIQLREKGTVQFSNSAYEIKLLQPKHNGIRHALKRLGAGEVEVIGNIYENPELLVK